MEGLTEKHEQMIADLVGAVVSRIQSAWKDGATVPPDTTEKIVEDYVAWMHIAKVLDIAPKPLPDYLKIEVKA